MDTEAIRILIADDNPEFREGLRGLLAGALDTAVVGEATTGDQAIALAGRLQPDVILMDLKMPGLNGIEATRRIAAALPHIGILVVTMFEDDDSVFAAMRAGARGYLLKDADQEDLLRAIQAVSRGEAIFSPAIARRLMQYFGAPPAASPQAFPELTEREREVLRLLAQGLTNAAIAERLFLSPRTVKSHVAHIYGKLGVDNRAAATRFAVDHGLA